MHGNSDFDCIGIAIDSWSDTKVVFHFGNTFGSTNIPDNAYFLHKREAFTAHVGAATFTGVTTVPG